MAHEPEAESYAERIMQGKIGEHIRSIDPWLFEQVHLMLITAFTRGMTAGMSELMLLADLNENSTHGRN